ncbi:MAG TPA: hypothetical protein VMZ27_04775 [Candidatus Saccharimonadales bacterium]|nr:hypothetical protein [Candidatus Saccharimonadales bacterium]
MDNINPVSIPPPIPAAYSPTLAPGESPEDRIPINGFITAVEAILRQPRRVIYQLGQGSSTSLTAALLTIAVLCAGLYGLVVGTFSMGEQLWAAPVKVVLGLLVCGFICLPSLYIFSCLSGSEARLGTVLGMLAGLLALMTILLIGFAPVAWVFSQSTNSPTMMGGLHLVFWFVATIFGMKFLFTGMRHLRLRSSGGLQVWTIIFILVMLQMTTALRPLVEKGTFLPKEKKFFLAHWIDSINKEEKKNDAVVLPPTR